LRARRAAHQCPRIGPGPWYNVRHQLIASNLADLHGDQRDRNNIRRETVLHIKGEVIPGNQHDILTGSKPDGRASIDGYDHTCNNWTSDIMTYPQANRMCRRTAPAPCSATRTAAARIRRGLRRI
jgi:hypothetical protein